MAGTVGFDDRIRYLLIGLGVGILGLVVGIVLTLAARLALLAADVSIGLSGLIVVSLVLTQGVGMGGVALGYLRHRGLSLDFVGVRVPTLRGWIWSGAGYVLALGSLFVAVYLVFVAAGAPETQNQAAQVAMREPTVLLFMIPASFLLIGPGEELLFRGVVQGTLREVFGPVGAIVLASGIFAAIHVVALTGGPVARLAGVLVLFFPSLILGIAYERTNNLVVPILIHAGFNATLFTMLYVRLRYGGGI